MEESLDLLKAFLIFRHIEVLLDDSNKHIEDDNWYQVSKDAPSSGSFVLQFANMNQRTQNEAPIQEVP